MKEEVQTKIMAARKNIVVEKRQSKMMMLSVAYQPLVFNTESVLSVNVRIIPKTTLINSPLEIQLRGFSNLQTINNQTEKTQDNLENTVEAFMQNQDKMQANMLISGPKPNQVKKPEQAIKTEDLQRYKQEEGQYFLQGGQVLYQLDDKSKSRLQFLQDEKQYVYPVQFTLPAHLPESLSNILIKNILITIKYTLELKIITVDKMGNKEEITHVLPFQITSPPKVYPYEELVVKQKIRCYHPLGKTQDKSINNFMTKFIKCLCPNIIFEKYLRSQQILKTSYSNYDLFHLELLAVVYQDHSIHLTVRSYKDPQIESLTQHRQKQEPKPLIKEVNSMGEIPNENDISRISMKDTNRKAIDLCVQKVEVELIGKIQNICTESIFKKIIVLNQSNFDMIQGEIILKLTELLKYPKSFKNQLFTLSYHFKVTAFFGEGEDQTSTIFEDFVTEQVLNELLL